MNTPTPLPTLPGCASPKGFALFAPLPALVLALAALSPPAMAQSAHGHHGHRAAAAESRLSDFVDAEVRRVDADRGRLTLRHAEIKALEMPPMTMVFTVADKALLDGVAAGDRIQVRVSERQGAYVVTELRKAP